MLSGEPMGLQLAAVEGGRQARSPFATVLEQAALAAAAPPGELLRTVVGAWLPTRAPASSCARPPARGPASSGARPSARAPASSYALGPTVAATGASPVRGANTEATGHRRHCA